jgi:cbb3-type cytochrome oxidase maturation protein
MDILFLLVPLSVLLALAVLGVLAWAVWSGQFEELESEGQRIFQQDAVSGAQIAQKEVDSPQA